MSLSFTGVRWTSPLDLALSQMYLCRESLDFAGKTFSPDFLCAHPLKVFDFGSGRLTLAMPEDVEKAFLAWDSGLSAVPVMYHHEDAGILNTVRELYLDEIRWCEHLGLHSVADLKNRIVPQEAYDRLFIRRCQRGSDLFLEVAPDLLPVYATLHPELHLYGISEDLQTLYFEDENGQETQVAVP